MDKRRFGNTFHRLVNPMTLRRRTQPVLETTGRNSGQPHRTPISGTLCGSQFWLVSMNGESADYVRNIKVNNLVRLRIDGRWRSGYAYLMPEDDAAARNSGMSGLDGLVNRVLGTDLLSIRVDLDP